jgi:hypothetical protein
MTLFKDDASTSYFTLFWLAGWRGSIQPPLWNFFEAPLK